MSQYQNMPFVDGIYSRAWGHPTDDILTLYLADGITVSLVMCPRRPASNKKLGGSNTTGLLTFVLLMLTPRSLYNATHVRYKLDNFFHTLQLARV